MPSETHRSNSQVLETLLGRIAREHPDWRLTEHTTDSGRQVQMIEYADEDGSYTPGLPGEFVSLVSECDTSQEGLSNGE